MPVMIKKTKKKVFQNTVQNDCFIFYFLGTKKKQNYPGYNYHLFSVFFGVFVFVFVSFSIFQFFVCLFVIIGQTRT